MAEMTPEQTLKVKKCVDKMKAAGSKLDKDRMFAVCSSSVMKSSSSKKTEDKKEEKQEEVKILENQDVTFTEHFNVSEAKEDGFKEIQFTALQSGVSGNGRRYKKEEISKQNLSGLKMFVDHSYEADNAVGIIKESNVQGLKLKAVAKVFNTAKHPDMLEMIDKGLIDSVSIGGKGDIKRIKEGDNFVDEVQNLQVKEVSFVGLGGVPGAKVTGG